MDLVGLLQVKPPNFFSAGLPSLSTYPTTGSSLSDSRDALNWEASGHSSAWSTFCYLTVGASGLTSATLQHDVTRDIWGHAVFRRGRHRVPAELVAQPRPLDRDRRLRRQRGHACGHRCNGSTQSTDGGVWHVSHSRMYQAIVALGAGYAR